MTIRRLRTLEDARDELDILSDRDFETIERLHGYDAPAEYVEYLMETEAIEFEFLPNLHQFAPKRKP